MAPSVPAAACVVRMNACAWCALRQAFILKMREWLFKNNIFLT